MGTHFKQRHVQKKHFNQRYARKRHIKNRHYKKINFFKAGKVLSHSKIFLNSFCKKM
jgi:hypothetical protein